MDVSVYSMVKPNALGSFANAATSFASSKNFANCRSKSLSQGTRLKMDFWPSNTGRDHGKGWQLESIRAGSSNCGVCSSIVRGWRAFLKTYTQTQCETAVLIAFTIAWSFKSTGCPNAFCSKNSLTLGAKTAN